MRARFFHIPAVGGALLSLAAFTVWACGDALVKIAGLAGVETVTLLFLSSVSAVVTLLAGLVATGRGGKLNIKNKKPHIIRSLIFVCISFFYVQAFTNLPLTHVYLVVFSAPFLLALCGKIFLGEAVSSRQWAAIGVGFAGVAVAIMLGWTSGQTGPGNPVVGYAVLPIVVAMYVLNTLLLRAYGKTETAESLAFFPFLARGVVFFPLALGAGEWSMPWPIFLAVIGAGALGGVGFLCFSAALQRAPVAVVSSLHYVQWVIGLGFGLALWGHTPTAAEALGAGLIMASGILVAHEARRQSRAAQEAEAQRRALLEAEP